MRQISPTDPIICPKIIIRVSAISSVVAGRWYGEPVISRSADQLFSKYLIYGNYNVRTTLNKAGGDYYHVSYNGNSCVVYGVKYLSVSVHERKNERAVT